MPMKRILANAALVFCSGLNTLISGKAVLRAYFSVTYFRPTQSEIHADFEVLPDSDWVYGFHRSDTKLQTNSWGFRGPEFSPQKMADEYRIVMSGDSITAGAKYGWDKSTSTSLEEMLNTTDSENISVYNLRVTGYNTHQELATLVEVGVNLSPDIVILNLCLNDSDPVMMVWQAGLRKKARISNLGDINHYW
jgi:hypothetical protein